MSRGTQTIELMTPVEGARFDLPVHKLNPDMLAAGSFNVVCDPTNILRTRNGYTRLAAPGPTKPITGGISWEGAGGEIFTIVADTNNWWRYTAVLPQPWVAQTDYEIEDLIVDSNGNTQECTTSGTTGLTQPKWATTLNATTTDGFAVWTLSQKGTITNWTPLGGTVPVDEDSFTVFANIAVSGVDHLYGVNQGSAGLVEWVAEATSVSPVTGLPFQSALGCFVLANRLVVYGTTESGVSYPHRVRWSQVNNPTIFPLAALADLGDAGGGIKAGLRMGALQAFFYLSGTQGTGMLQAMIAQVGDDANAFSFQEFALGEGIVPPASVAAIVAVQGIHYYLGNDGHIWTFNGISADNFGVAVQSDIQANADFSNLGHSFAVYVPGDRHGRFYFPSKNAYPDRCVYYSFDFQRWEAPAVYAAPFRSAFTGPLSSASEEIAFIGGVDTGGLFQLDLGVTDDGLPIPFNATWGVVNVDPLSEVAVQFAEAFIQQTNINDTIGLMVSGLRSPLDTLTTGAVFLMRLSQANDFQQLAAPGTTSASNSYYNWLQASLQGTVRGSLAFLGAYLHVTTQRKGVYNVKGRGPE